MNTSEREQLNQSQERLERKSEGLEWSVVLFRWIGYGLLILALFDLIETFVPPRLMNPAWEFQTLGVLVERVPVPLLGLVLVFYGKNNWRNRWEKPILKFLSWAALLFGVGLLLLIPLGVINTVRIDAYNNRPIIAQVNQRTAQIQQLKNELEKATTAEEMEAFLNRIQSDSQQLEKLKEQLSYFLTSGDQRMTEQAEPRILTDRPGKLAQRLKKSPLVNLEAPFSLSEVKKQILSFLASGEERMKKQVEARRSSQRLELLKKSVKWNLGALVSGVLFMRIWQATRWARRMRRSVY